MHKLLVILALGGTILCGAPDAADAGKKKGDGLVNLEVGDVTILEDSPIAVVVDAAVLACPAVTIGQVTILAAGVDNTNHSAVVCVQDDGDEVKITQNH